MSPRSFLREPLLHFLLVGLVLFLVYGKVASPSDEGNRITVSHAAIAALAGQFQATWSRPPSAAELAGLVDASVRDEILFREGAALGLLKNDPVIQRRVRQKLEVLVEEEGSAGAPTDSELEAYLQANREKFRRPAVLGFEQVLFVPTDYGSRLDAALASAKAALNGGAAPASQGKGSLLPTRVDGKPMDLIAREFGDEFSKSLETAPVGQWSGPVRSGFGVHLVRINQRKPGYAPSLGEIRKAVAGEWENERRTAALEANYARLREDYEVVIEGASAQASSK